MKHYMTGTIRMVNGSSAIYGNREFGELIRGQGMYDPQAKAAAWDYYRWVEDYALYRCGQLNKYGGGRPLTVAELGDVRNYMRDLRSRLIHGLIGPCENPDAWQALVEECTLRFDTALQHVRSQFENTVDCLGVRGTIMRDNPYGPSLW